jgi:hypothetical protein
MSSRLTARAATVTAAAAAVLAAVALPAPAATSPGWRVVQALGSPDSFGTYWQGAAVSGRANAWAAGTDTQSLVTEHWNGSAWQPIAPPPGFSGITSGGVNVFAVGTSSATNTWLFPQVSIGSRNVMYALRWNGSAWAKYALSTRNSVLSTAVVSPANVWAFGEKPGSPSSLGYGPPWALHFNGKAWHRVTVPAVPTAVSTVSGSDIWALGPGTRTYLAMHWNGRKWRSMKPPVPAPVKSFAWVPADIVALGPADVWVEEVVSVSRSGTLGPPGVALLHWNGKRWAAPVKDTADYFTAGIARDGRGGLWLPAFTSSGKNLIVHYLAGHWSQQAVPAPPGDTGQIGEFAWIPGTASAWAIGELNPDTATQAAIFKYGR